MKYMELLIIRVASREKVSSNMRKMRKMILPCTCAKYLSGLIFSFIHSVVSSNLVSRQRMSWSDCTDAQVDLDLRCLHKPYDTFLNGPAQNISLFLFIFTLHMVHCSDVILSLSNCFCTKNSKNGSHDEQRANNTEIIICINAIKTVASGNILKELEALGTLSTIFTWNASFVTLCFHQSCLCFI